MSESRREFELPGFDLEFLDGRGLPWETVIEGGVRWVVLHEYPVFDGYNHRAASAALRLSPSYPDTHIDMVYFSPHIARADGKPVMRLTDHAFDGKTWQQWSRHRTGSNPWRRGYDCIETHLLLVDEWLERELRNAA